MSKSNREVWVLEYNGDPVACSLHDGSFRPNGDFKEQRYVPAAPEPAVDVACKALARAMGLPADHPQGSNIAWLAGRAVALLEPAAADRAALDIELEADRFLGRYGEPFTEWQRKDLYALLRDVAAKSATEALVAASPDRYPAQQDSRQPTPKASVTTLAHDTNDGVAPSRGESGQLSHPAEVAAPPGEQWIPAGESSPEERQFAWVEIPGSDRTVMQWKAHHWWGLCHRGQPIAFRMSHIVRFCPLPAPPKGTP